MLDLNVIGHKRGNRKNHKKGIAFLLYETTKAY